MTVERRIIAGLEDIKAISLECKSCHSRVTFSADRKIDVPLSCERCGKPWRSPQSVSAYRTNDSAIVNLVQSIATIRTLISEDSIGFSILLEFEEPSL